MNLSCVAHFSNLVRIKSQHTCKIIRQTPNNKQNKDQIKQPARRYNFLALAWTASHICFATRKISSLDAATSTSKTVDLISHVEMGTTMQWLMEHILSWALAGLESYIPSWALKNGCCNTGCHPTSQIQDKYFMLYQTLLHNVHVNKYFSWEKILTETIYSSLHYKQRLHVFEQNGINCNSHRLLIQLLAF